MGYLEIAGFVIAGFIGFELGHYTLQALFNEIKGWFTKTSTTVTTPVPVTTTVTTTPSTNTVV